MGAFESPAKARTLILVVWMVSIGIVYFAKAEQQSPTRRRHETEAIVSSAFPSHSEPLTLHSSLQPGITKVFQFFQNASLETDAGVKRNNLKKFGGESSTFHRIRHALKKLDGGGLEEDVVYRMMLDSSPLQKLPNERKKVDDLERLHLNARDDLQPTTAQSQSIFPVERQFTVENPQSKFEGLLEQTPQPLTVSEQPQSQHNFIKQNTIPSEESIQVKRTRTSVEVCYGIDHVLVVIGITCGLNFAFVILIWVCVKLCSSAQDKDFQTMCGNGEDRELGEVEDDFWISTSGIARAGESGGKGFNPNQTSSTISLYSVKRDHPAATLTKTHSYSMEDLRYPPTSQ